MKCLIGLGLLVGLGCTLAFAHEYPQYPPQYSEYQPNPLFPLFQPPVPVYRPRPYRYEYGPQRIVCNTDWNPVCARTRQNIVARYSNRCYAEQDGALVIGPPEECELISCPATYEPVCARIAIDQGNNNELVDLETARRRNPARLLFKNQAFFNECAAREIGRGAVLTPYSEGRHRHYFEHRHFRGVIDMASVCPASCPPRIDLVCARDDQGRLRLYANRCAAIQEGAVFVNSGVCGGR
jgi:hypothetical protein